MTAWIALSALVATIVAACDADTGNRPAGRQDGGVSHRPTVSMALIDDTITLGGRPARFQVTIDAPEDLRQQRYLLGFQSSKGVGGESSRMRLEQRTDSGWTEVGTHTLADGEIIPTHSDDVAVALVPGQSTTYEFRVALFGTFRPCPGCSPDFESFDWEVSLWDRNGESVSTRKVAFSVEPPALPKVTVITGEPGGLGGPPTEVTVKLDNTEGRDRSGLELRLNLGSSLRVEQRPGVDDVTVELFRDGTWYPLQPVATDSVRYPLYVRLADGLRSPSGFQKSYRLRIRLAQVIGDGYITELEELTMTAGLSIPPGNGLRRTVLAADEAGVELSWPTVAFQQDKESPAPAGSPNYYRIAIENTTGVDYPPLYVVLVDPSNKRVGELSIAYRRAGDSTWIPAEVEPSRTDDHTTALARIPEPGTVAEAPDGYRQTYEVRLVSSRNKYYVLDVELFAVGIADRLYKKDLDRSPR